MLKHLFFIFLFISLRISLSAQQPYYYKIDDEAGLPSNEVYEVLQDDFGYMWIGCDAGLYRYDGFNFKAYTNPKQNGKSISYLRKDKKGRIWCKNFNGQIYRVDKEELKLIIDNSGLESSASQFTIDDNLNVWIANKDKLEMYNDEGKNKQVLYTSEGAAGPASSIYEIQYFDGLIYFTQYNKGLFSFNPLNSKVIEYSSQLMIRNHYGRFNLTTANNQLYLLAEDNEADLYSVFVLNDSLEHLQTNYFGKQNTRAYYLRQDLEGRIWICTSQGAQLLGKKEEPIFRDEKISFMLQDKEGNFWFTSLHNGIFLVPNLEVKVYSLSNVGKSNLTAVFANSNKDIICGDYSGLLYAKGANESVFKQVSLSSEKYGAVKKIAQVKDKLLISRAEFSILESSNYKVISDKRVNARDFAIMGDTLFAISYAGFSTRKLNDLNSKKNIETTYIRKIGGRAIYLDSSNLALLVAFNDGVFIYKDGSLNELLFNKEHVFVQSLAACGKKAWLVTSNLGVLFYENGKLYKSNLSSVGVDEKNVRSIFCKNNKLICCGLNELFIHDLTTKQTKVFKQNVGINARDVTAIELVDSNIYLATNKGMLSFPFNLNDKNTVTPNVAIDKIIVEEDTLFDKNYLELNYHNKNLSIYFTATAFRSKGLFVYQYRLLGLDSAWRNVNAKEANVVFSSLPPGSYIFELRAVNESGVSSAINNNLKIEVLKPVWQKWWFYLLVILLTAALVTFLFIYRIKTIRKKAEVKQNLTSSQLAAIKAQMNPHFMYNTLNSIQDLILKSDIKNTNYYLSRFSSLMRKILDASQSNDIVLEEEIEILELYLSLEKLRFGDDFTFEINIDKAIDIHRTHLPSIIIQPFVENALKHGLLHKKGPKLVKLDFELKDKILLCSITDNGVGRKKAAEIKERSPIKHTSFATRATEKRLELINSDKKEPIQLEIIDLEEDGVPMGTKVVLRVSLS